MWSLFECICGHVNSRAHVRRCVQKCFGLARVDERTHVCNHMYMLCKYFVVLRCVYICACMCACMRVCVLTCMHVWHADKASELGKREQT